MTRDETNDLLDNYTDAKCCAFYARLRDNEDLCFDGPISWQNFNAIHYILSGYFKDKESK